MLIDKLIDMHDAKMARRILGKEVTKLSLEKAEKAKAQAAAAKAQAKALAKTKAKAQAKAQATADAHGMFACPVCNKRFNSIGGMRGHRTKMHG